jgi:hypothetical protein
VTAPVCRGCEPVGDGYACQPRSVCPHHTDTAVIALSGDLRGLDGVTGVSWLRKPIRDD